MIYKSVKVMKRKEEHVFFFLSFQSLFQNTLSQSLELKIKTLK